MDCRFFRDTSHPSYGRIREDVEDFCKKTTNSLKRAAHLSVRLKMPQTDACKNPIL